MDRTVSIQGKARVYTRLICIFIGMVVDSLSSTTIKTLTPYFVTFTECPNATCPKDIGSVPAIQVYGLSFVFAGSEAMHILALPFAGSLCESVGSDLPLIFGFLGQTISSIFFAFGNSQPLYIIARVFLGIGSAFIGTAGMRFIAESTNAPKMRDTLFAISYCLYGFACLGPTYSGVLFHFTSLTWTFLPIAILCLICIVILAAVTRVQTEVSESVMTWYRHADENASCGELLLDPYVVLTAIGIALSQFPEACLAPAIALWISETYGWPVWKLGVAFIPSFVGYMLSMMVCMFVTSSASNYTYLTIIIGFILGAFGNVYMSIDGGYSYFVIGILFMAFSFTIAKFCLVAILASIGRIRFSSSPGRIFSVFKLSSLVPFVIGPIISLPTDQVIGLPKMCIITASLVVLFSPLMLILRRIPSLYAESEDRQLMEEKQNSYTDSDDSVNGTTKIKTELEND